MTLHTARLPEQLVPGRRLGRHIAHDDRSRDYPYEVTGRRPSWMVNQRRVPIFDQGELGSCTGNAMAGALGTSPLFDLMAEQPVPDEAMAVALYSRATHVDRIRGVYPPTDTGSSGLAVAKAAKEAGYITSYRHAFTFETVLAAIAHGPVITGINWYSSFDQPDHTGHVAITAGARVRGGHEVVLVGYNDATRLLTAANSWGASWGHSGYFTIGYSDFQRLMAEGGDVTVPIR